MAISSFADSALLLVAPRRRGATAGAVLVAIAIAVAAVLALRLDGERSAPRARSADGRVSVAVPDGWRALAPGELRKVASAPSAVVRRADGRGLVVVPRGRALGRSTRSLPRALPAQMGRRFRGVKPVSARTVQLDGGPAYVYPFARPAAGAVQSIAVVPRAGDTYTLDAVTGAGAADVAAQAGAILRSFDTTAPAPRS